jgi:hypothetical protein
MTRDEALTVAQILLTADGGCPVCVRALFLAATEAFPQQDWKALAKEVGFEEERWGEDEPV